MSCKITRHALSLPCGCTSQVSKTNGKLTLTFPHATAGELHNAAVIAEASAGVLRFDMTMIILDMMERRKQTGVRLLRRVRVMLSSTDLDVSWLDAARPVLKLVPATTSHEAVRLVSDDLDSVIA